MSNADGDFILKVDALDLLQKAMHKMLARLLPIAQDIKPRVFVRLDPSQRGIGLGSLQFGPSRLPFWPEFLGLGKPRRFGQTARDRGLKHIDLPKNQPPDTFRGNDPSPATCAHRQHSVTSFSFRLL